MTQLAIHQLLSWSKPVQKMTFLGERLVSEAAPNAAFWEAWRERKDEIKQMGYSVSKVGAGFVVYRYQPLTEEIIEKKVAAREESRAISADIPLPAPAGLDYLPYQKAGIRYALNREAVLIADEMGLGKTIQGIGILNTSKAKSALIICPASLKLNWLKELNKWLTEQRSVAIAASGKPFPKADIVIINYDILVKFEAELRTKTWDVLISDECQYLKNPKAQRTMAVVGGTKTVKDKASGASTKKKIDAIAAKRRVLLTGTPIMNRPVELWSLVHYLSPKSFNNFFSFAKRYCNAHNNGYGWDFSGASNLPELQNRLREEFMIRRLKSEVLKDLPAKVRQIITLEPDAAGKAAIAAENSAEARMEAIRARLETAAELAKAESEEAYKEAADKLRDHTMAAFTEMAKLRQETALVKLPAVIEYLHDQEHPIVIMAHHKAVIAQIKADLGDRAVVLTGETPMADRQKAVEDFQAGKVQYFIGSIKAAGVGLTLTRASHVVFVELDWTPGAMTQAEDRCHRIGQRDSVLVQHMVLDGSLDARMANTLISKQAVADEALDTKVEGLDEIGEDTTLAKIDMTDIEARAAARQAKEAAFEAERVAKIARLEQEIATKNAKQAEIAKQAESMTDVRIAAVHTCLRILAGMDTDRASQRNDCGFNKADSNLGAELAGRSSLTPKQAVLGLMVIRKYHRQLPGAVLAMAKGENTTNPSLQD